MQGGDALADGNSRKSVMGTGKCQALKSSVLRKRLTQLALGVLIRRVDCLQQKGDLSERKRENKLHRSASAGATGR